MVRAGWDFLVCWLVGTLSWLVVWVYFRFWGLLQWCFCACVFVACYVGLATAVCGLC